MRVALVTNVLDQRMRGNYTTIARWLSHVRGVAIKGVPADGDQFLDPVPHIVHGYHALHGGVAAHKLSLRYGLPLVISLGGTDLFACMKGDAQVADVLAKADCITGAFPAFGQMLDECFGRPMPYVTVPRGVHVPRDVPPHHWDGRLHVLLPAGLRPAKDPLLAIDMAEELAEAGLPLTLRILGPEMHCETTRRVRKRAGGLEYVTLGEVEPELMAEAYAAADVVWNTSIYEGGSNSLLEAVAYGCAIFARDIPGNRELIGRSGELGTLFDPENHAHIAACHRALLEETEAARHDRIERGRTYLREHHDPNDEARKLEGVWRNVLD